MEAGTASSPDYRISIHSCIVWVCACSHAPMKTGCQCFTSSSSPSLGHCPFTRRHQNHSRRPHQQNAPSRLIRTLLSAPNGLVLDSGSLKTRLELKMFCFPPGVNVKDPLIFVGRYVTGVIVCDGYPFFVSISWLLFVFSSSPVSTRTVPPPTPVSFPPYTLAPLSNRKILCTGVKERFPGLRKE
jgi:hypothetical protein